MNITLNILGTASALPISGKNPSAQVLNVHGRLFLIDCAEGTQVMMRKMHLSFNRIEAIFLSHLHGDHFFGIFGLLTTMSMLGRTGDLHIFGPKPLDEIIGFFLKHHGEAIKFKISVHELEMAEPEVIMETKNIEVKAFPMNHRIETFGYIFTETKAENPRSYAYCSDTAPFPELAQWVRGVDLLYHEATYPAEMTDKAAARYHSTTVQAAECAVKAGVGRLLIGHYSSKYPDHSIFLNEVREIFPESDLAEDGMVVELPQKKCYL